MDLDIPWNKWTIFFLLNLADFWQKSLRIFFSPTKKPIRTEAIRQWPNKIHFIPFIFFYFLFSPITYWKYTLLLYFLCLALPYLYYQSLVRGNIIFVSGQGKVLEKKGPSNNLIIKVDIFISTYLCIFIWHLCPHRSFCLQ